MIRSYPCKMHDSECSRPWTKGKVCQSMWSANDGHHRESKLLQLSYIASYSPFTKLPNFYFHSRWVYDRRSCVVDIASLPSPRGHPQVRTIDRGDGFVSVRDTTEMNRKCINAHMFGNKEQNLLYFWNPFSLCSSPEPDSWFWGWRIVDGIWGPPNASGVAASIPH